MIPKPVLVLTSEHVASLTVFHATPAGSKNGAMPPASAPLLLSADVIGSKMSIKSIRHCILDCLTPRAVCSRALSGYCTATNKQCNTARAVGLAVSLLQATVGDTGLQLVAVLVACTAELLLVAIGTAGLLLVVVGTAGLLLVVVGIAGMLLVVVGTAGLLAVGTGAVDAT